MIGWFLRSRTVLILGGAVGTYAVMTFGAPGILFALGLNGLLLTHQVLGRPE